GMEEQHGLVVGAELGLAVAQDARPFALELVTGGDDVLDLVADMVHAARRIALEEIAHRRVSAIGLQELDLGVVEDHERHGHAMRRQGHGIRYLGAQRVTVNRCRLLHIGHDDGDVVEPADHAPLPPQILIKCISVTGFFPCQARSERRTASRAASRNAASSRRSRGPSSSSACSTRWRSSSVSDASSSSAPIPCTVTCGGERSRPSLSTTMVASAAPLKVMRWRERNASAPDGKSRVPSTTSRPVGTSPMTAAGPGASFTTSPLRVTRACGTWHCSARRACAMRWRVSPCTGTAIFGRTIWYMLISSSCAGWPETWTRWYC